VEDKLALLRRVPLFQGVESGRLKVLAEQARLCVYPEGAAIVEQGEQREESQDGDSLYVIVEGRVRVMRAQAGREEQLATLGPGEFFGEMALLDGKPRSASVLATEDTRCLILARWDLLRAMRHDPEIAIQMLTVLSTRLRSMQDQLD
jgi:CRP/FNR family cyclic AMP-dependent transcriptional regulator